MDVATHARRRKACDFCVSRKIRCDGSRPTCSNCKLYGVDCRITNITNTAKRRAPPAPAVNPTSTRITHDHTLEARLARVESRLDRIDAEQMSNSQKGQTTATSPPGVNTRQINFESLPEIRVYKAADMWNAGSTLPCLGLSPEPLTEATILRIDRSHLPPLAEILLVLDNYFDNYNCFIPLFDRTSFMHMVIDWYSTPTKRAMISWAAINIVLAISYRVVDDVPTDNPKLSQCISNVQSVMIELMSWNENLLGLQVLLGMVILFQGTTNPQLAITLIGSAIRLAQTLGLPSRSGDANLPPQASLQRRRIFWIAYILDKDLSLRAKAPYAQFDAETDLDLPDEHGEDDLGILAANDGQVRFNYFRTRAELAVIQGKVHNLLYSRTAQWLDEGQRFITRSRIKQMLSDWRTKIPTELTIGDQLLKNSPRMGVQLMTNLLNRHLECLYRMHGIFAFDDPWINKVRSYLPSREVEVGEGRAGGEMGRQAIASLPDEWEECVHYCRIGLALSTIARETEYSVWLHVCCNISSLIILLVNMIEYPNHPEVVTDGDLATRTRTMFEQINSKVSHEPFFLLTVVRDLNERARSSLGRSAHRRISGDDETLDGNSTILQNWLDLNSM